MDRRSFVKNFILCTVSLGCQNKSYRSPNISGEFYDARLDPKNWITSGKSVLTIDYAECIDNGEGDSWPHGPYGSIYVDFFLPSEPINLSYDEADKRRISLQRKLRGPHRTGSGLDEWLDGDKLNYQNAGIYQWKPDEKETVMRIWESDFSEDGQIFGINWGRRNDVLGMELIRKEDTVQPDGILVPFHKYTNDHPRKRTKQVTFWLKLRTRDWNS